MRPDARAWIVLLALGALGCRQDMHDQAKYEPLEASELWADGTSARSPVAGTVARGHLDADKVFYSGIDADGHYVTTLPVELTAELVRRGRDRFDAFCSPCHGRRGDGLGMIVRRGFKRPTSFHEPRLRAAAPGYFFDVMTRGLGQMSSYAPQLAPRDRWAVAAYLKALQLSGHAPAEVLTAEERQRLDRADGEEAAVPAPEADTE